MCTTCGCSDDARTTLTNVSNGETVVVETHEHTHHAHAHLDDTAHTHAGAHGTTIALEKAVLAKNDRLAERNRGWFAGRGILALNLVSSPGAGKTTLLERTIRELRDAVPIFVIEGDQETARDAQRIRAAGCRGAVQINTGAGCHLDAHMIGRALEELRPTSGSLVLIENVGNLVCPALFDLGELSKVAILSVTEGDDKPIKYPHIFRASDVIIVNKTDLLPYVSFDLDHCSGFVRQVNPDAQIIPLSAATGEGMDAWRQWLMGLVALHRGAATE